MIHALDKILGDFLKTHRIITCNMYIGTVYASAVISCRTLYCRVYPLSLLADTINFACQFTYALQS